LGVVLLTRKTKHYAKVHVYFSGSLMVLKKPSLRQMKENISGCLIVNGAGYNGAFHYAKVILAMQQFRNAVLNRFLGLKFQIGLYT
jgi:hypothetical protein